MYSANNDLFYLFLSVVTLLVCIYTVRHDAQIYGHIRFFVLSVAMVTTITERSFTELSLVKAVVNPKTLVL